MLDNPKSYDAVIGGHSPTPIGALVLGGVEGVKARLKSPSIPQRILALKEAEKYGDAGIKIAIETLDDSSGEVVWAAYRMLVESKEPRAKNLLEIYNPYSLFECVATFDSQEEIYQLTLLPGNKEIAVAGEDLRGIKILDITTGACVRTLNEHARYAFCLTVIPGTNILASGDAQGTIKLWDIDTARSIRTIKAHPGRVNSLAASPDGKVLVSGGSNWGDNIKYWSVESGLELRTLNASKKAAVNSIAITPDSKMLVVGLKGGFLKVWDFKTGKWLCSRDVETDWINSIAVMPDSSAVVVGGHSGIVKYINLLDSTIPFKEIVTHEGAIRAVAVSPEGNAVFSGGVDRLLKLWEQNSSRSYSLGQHPNKSSYLSERIASISISDGVVVSGSLNGTIKVWKMCDRHAL